VAELQTQGFKIRTQQKPDNAVPPDHVIKTDPAGNTSVNAGDEILISVSTGPEQREVPDVSALSYADAVKKLTAAGFGKFKKAEAASSVEQRDQVLNTVPPANQTSAITNEITIVVGTGPAGAVAAEALGRAGRRSRRELVLHVLKGGGHRPRERRQTETLRGGC
jgi:serine/threonine-protein kinase